MRDLLAQQPYAQAGCLVLDGVSGYNIEAYLFGSRATGTARKTSDIDIALLPLKPLPVGFLAGLNEV